MAQLTTGILRKSAKGGMGLFDPAIPGAEKVQISPSLIEQYHLVEGATVSGHVQTDKSGNALTTIEKICGLKPPAFLKRKRFSDLVAIDPVDRFHLAVEGDTSMRVVDLIAPIAKGTRGLIVAPPKVGKTMLLEKIARGIHIANPETRVISLLIDERPEEVTYFRRMTSATVIASSSDQTTQEHVALSEFILAYVRTELECGHEVVVLLDSMTRLVRAFNMRSSATGRTLSGGVDASALEIPRRLFGLARNVEKGGSVTIIASMLVDTGSRMDQLIYEEFKATGNSEIVLSRTLSDLRIFPAINPASSSTRKADKFYSVDENRRINLLRRALAGRKPAESMTWLLKMLDKYPTNEALLQSIVVDA